MDSLPCYERDPYQRELATEVVEVGNDGRPWSRLADTILYPEGGGQPADHGHLDSLPVLDVQRVDGGIRHYSLEPAALGPVAVRLDWQRRFDHMQHHTGQHLLSALAQDRFGWATRSFHLGNEVCSIELDVDGLSEARCHDLEEAVAAEIRAARAVTPRRISSTDLGPLAVRSRGLPLGHVGPVRIVEIAELDRNTCGGTHVGSTSEIESLHLIGSERLRGGTRLFFVVGRRARRRMAAHEDRVRELRRLLGAGDDDLTTVIEAKLAESRDAARRERALRDELADAVAEALAGRPETVVAAHFEALDGAFLQRLGPPLVARATAKVALLTAGSGTTGYFHLAVGAASGCDAMALGSQIAAVLCGRGGGRGAHYQGRCDAVAGRVEALAILRGPGAGA